VIERFMVKINNPLASDAFEVLMILRFCIETFGVPRTLDNEGRADPVQRQQRSVDGVERDAWEDLSHLTVDHLSRRVLICFQQGLVYRRTLWRDSQPGVMALCMESLHLFFHAWLVRFVCCPIHPHPS
jgi:hypothetical protein